MRKRKTTNFTLEELNKMFKIEKQIIYHSFSTPHYSTDLWFCSCNQWRRANERCAHLIQNGVIIDSRAEKTNEMQNLS
jgi:hypothetical protein